MPNYTEHYNAIKPNEEENYSVDVANTNNDLWDEELYKKQDKIVGKGLSTNDFTNEYKNKLDNIQNYDDTTLKYEINKLKNEKVDKEEGYSLISDEGKAEMQSNITNLQNAQATQSTTIQALQSENTRLKKNQIYGTATGTEVEITDSAEMGASIGVSGNSTQDEEPSPSNPSEIKNLTGNTMCKIRNKNWFNNDVTYYKTNNTAELEKINTGIRAKVLTGGYNFISGYILLDYEKMVGKEFTLSATIKPSGNNNGRVMLYWYCDNTLLSYIPQMLDNTGNITFTMPDEAPETANQLRLTFYANRNGTAVTGDYVDYINVQLERGSTATSYEPHQEKSITFPFGEQKLAKGDYLASDGIHNVRVQKVFDGSSNENWTLSATLTTVTRFLINCINAPVTLIEQLCSHFKYLYKYSDDTEHFYINPSNGSLFIFINTSTAGTVEELKAWLSNEPITIECEPESGVTVTPYTQAQQTAYNNLQNLILFEGYNHIEMISPNGVKANLTVDYTKSTKMVINDIEERLSVLEYAGLEG